MRIDMDQRNAETDIAVSTVCTVRLGWCRDRARMVSGRGESHESGVSMSIVATEHVENVIGFATASLMAKMIVGIVTSRL